MAESPQAGAGSAGLGAANSTSTSASDSTSLSTLIDGTSSQWITRAVLLASWTLLFYDHGLLLGLEVEKIWKARWTPVKCYYVLLRLINVAFLIGNTYGGRVR